VRRAARGRPQAKLAGIGSGCGILAAGVAAPPETRQAADAYVAAFNDLTAGNGLRVSVEPVFATSA
jgi:hypothetical protein